MISNVKHGEGSTFRATIDGVRYSGIYKGCEYWQIIQDWIADGNTPEPEHTPDELTAQEQAQKVAELQATDKNMARIAEDLIDTLTAKGVITMGDLPQDARDKLTDRKAKRAALGSWVI